MNRYDMTSLINACPVPAIVFRKVGNTVVLDDWNQAAFDMTRGQITKCRGNAEELDFLGRSPEILEDLKKSLNQKKTFRKKHSVYTGDSGRMADCLVHYVFISEGKVEVFLFDLTGKEDYEKTILFGRETLNLLAEHYDFMLITYDRQARVRYFFGPAHFGIIPQKVIGKKAGEILGNGDGKPIESIVRKVFSAGVRVDRENRYIRNGKEFWTNESYYPMSGGEKEGIRFVGSICRDISEFRNLKNNCEKNEQRYHEVFRRIKDGICYCEVDSGHKGKKNVVIRDFNPAFGELLGLSGEVLTGKKLQDILPEMARFQFDDNELSGPFEFSRPALGKFLHARIHSLERDGFILILEDVTEKKNAEEQILNSERKYREITDLIRIIILETDLEMNILYSNLYASMKLFGRSYRPAEKMNLIDLIEPGDRAKFQKNFRDIVTGSDSEMKAFHLRNSKGVRMFALSNAVQILNGNEVTGVRIAIFELNEIAETIVFPDNELNRKYGLSKREADVLFSLVSGLTDQDIAEKLFISKPTVRFHITNLYNKLGVNKKKELLEFMKNNFVKKLGYENMLIYILNSFLKE